LQQEMDELFGRFFGENRSISSGGWYAPVSLWEDEKQLRLEMELPGVRKEDVDLTVHQGNLRISAERKGTEEERRYWYNERRFGRLERVIPLPEAVDASHIDAELRDGVLHVTLAKKPEAQPMKISVKGE
jgi:HSP20 family protein